DEAQRASIVREIFSLAGDGAPVFNGSPAPSEAKMPATPASDAIAGALNRGPLTIIALGPLANIAATLDQHPDLASKVERLVMVAGKPSGRLLHPGKHWWFHFGDFNVSQDVDAVRAVLRAGVPITLVPFDLAVQVEVAQSDIDELRRTSRLARWLAQQSE